MPPRKISRRPPRRVKLVGKKEFAAVALDPESETFVEHVASLSSDASPSSSPLGLDAHPAHRPQSLQPQRLTRRVRPL